jgi:hypothetical protein
MIQSQFPKCLTGDKVSCSSSELYLCRNILLSAAGFTYTFFPSIDTVLQMLISGHVNSLGDYTNTLPLHGIVSNFYALEVKTSQIPYPLLCDFGGL